MQFCPPAIFLRSDVSPGLVGMSFGTMLVGDLHNKLLSSSGLMIWLLVSNFCRPFRSSSLGICPCWMCIDAVHLNSPCAPSCSTIHFLATCLASPFAARATPMLLPSYAAIIALHNHIPELCPPLGNFRMITPKGGEQKVEFKNQHKIDHTHVCGWVKIINNLHFACTMVSRSRRLATNGNQDEDRSFCLIQISCTLHYRVCSSIGATLM